ncbi:XRE family transcriptional regulator [Methylobacterium currus]|uniref:XRE family transcriptional regulator n=1 Tax=Methylobacterium currus TaxID=2051553 RepID=A0A2R4WG81_9HYPH|nr:helix-turn-helix transcriptional regulator [Methylobacterium currus]AWB20540.1 XRE family transcriptional regulator [Methylobacterium currus]
MMVDIAIPLKRREIRFKRSIAEFATWATRRDVVTLRFMKATLNYAIGTRVRRAREAAGLTQEALAGSIDRSKEAISNIERGINLPTIDTLQRICDVTGINISFMFEQSPEDRDVLDLKTKADILMSKMNVSELRFIVNMIELYNNHKSEVIASE